MNPFNLLEPGQAPAIDAGGILNGVLGQEHLDCLNRVCTNTPTALEVARVCKDCGLPVDELIGTLNGQLHMAQEFKKRFFPSSI